MTEQIVLTLTPLRQGTPESQQMPLHRYGRKRPLSNIAKLIHMRKCKRYTGFESINVKLSKNFSMGVEKSENSWNATMIKGNKISFRYCQAQGPTLGPTQGRVRVKVKVKARTWSGHGQVRS